MAIAPAATRAVLARLPGAARTSGLGIVSLFAIILAAMTVLEPVFWTHVGLFRYPDGAVGLGILARTAGAQDLLGWWSVPVSLTVSILLLLLSRAGLRTGRDRMAVC